MSKQILIPQAAVPNFCDKCGSPIVNIERARVVNPSDRKREPFLCLHYQPARATDPAVPELPEGMTREEGRICHHQRWISPKPVSVGIFFWRDTKGVLYVLMELRGIPPGLNQWAYVAGFVEPGDSGWETVAAEVLQELALEVDFSLTIMPSSKDGHVKNWKPVIIDQVSPPNDPMLLLTFFTHFYQDGGAEPRLVPDGTETLLGKWHRYGQESELDMAWPWQIQMVERAARALSLI